MPSDHTALDAELDENAHFPADTLLGASERRGNMYLGGWRQLLTDAAMHLWEQTPAFKAVSKEHDRVADEMEGLVTQEQYRVLDDQPVRMWLDALEYGVLLGYGLGRTAVAGVEHLDDWLDRARAFVSLEEVERGRRPVDEEVSP